MNQMMFNTTPVAVAEDSRNMYRYGGVKLDARWCFTIGASAGGSPAREIGSFETITHFWQFYNSICLSSLEPGTRLDLFKHGAQAAVVGKFTLKNRYGPVDHGKVWHILALALVGNQLEHSAFVRGASLSFTAEGVCVDVWVCQSQEALDISNSLKLQLAQITAMTEGPDAWVEYVHLTQPGQAQTVQPKPEQPAMGRARPSHRKSRSHPQTVSQAFLDAEIENRNNQPRKQAKTDAQKDTVIPTDSLSTAFEPVQQHARCRDQIAPAFVFSGVLYPAGLSRRQRRSVQFSGRQGHKEADLVHGLFVGHDVQDGQVGEERAKELTQLAERLREEEIPMVEEEGDDEESDGETDSTVPLPRVRSSSCLSCTNSSDSVLLRRVLSSPSLLSVGVKAVPSFIALPKGLSTLNACARWADDLDSDEEL